MFPRPRIPSRGERGSTIAELMMALVVLSVGILAIAQLFPTGTRKQLEIRLMNSANYYAQEKLEQVRGLAWTDAGLTDGRHPASGTESLGASGQWQRWYVVTTMSAPLASLKRVTVTVQWSLRGPHEVTATTYVRR